MPLFVCLLALLFAVGCGTPAPSAQVDLSYEEVCRRLPLLLQSTPRDAQGRAIPLQPAALRHSFAEESFMEGRRWQLTYGLGIHSEDFILDRRVYVLVQRLSVEPPASRLTITADERRSLVSRRSRPDLAQTELDSLLELLRLPAPAAKPAP